MNRRVAVTGAGVICASGNNRDAFWRSIARGENAVTPLQGFDGLRFSHGARLRGYQPLDHFTEKELDLLDPFAQFALIAAREAVKDSSVVWTNELRERSGVITGSCLGGKLTEDDAFRELYAEKKTRFHPMIIPRTMANAAASLIGMELGLTGASFTFSTACSSANHALAHAFAMVRYGQLDLAIAGGSEAPFTLGHLKVWEGMRVVAPDTCRPFSRDRKGLILAEGAAMLVLEPLDAAEVRGSTVYAEIIGAGMTADAHHITQPSAEGAARAMRLALQDAQIAPQQIGYINAHGTGTPANDATETQAIRMLFKDHADKLAVSSTKSMHGHALGAAGALEAAATVLALHHGVLPPTANYTTPDPECDLDVIPNAGRRAEIGYALSNSFAFGGLNAVLAFRRH
ncbi:MAG TPA: beta-ketoacyl-[acyl-carrier-protein] synthase family protein [Bryobacteraceae bacterium]|nr:beta-ketoacyl-[acyl-carrier-protein] synthase family protein [Bryobacteraceae bacterium]